ncbi:MAG TPA: phosphatase PAP2 family protein [Caldilineaceae bacterium]|nr:phosphatase PAP2 family protein [Caldilineaceae bacterium]
MADQAAGADKDPKSDRPPEQKLGDTPVAPWNMPTPAEKQAAKPVRRALRQALQEVDSQEKADVVVDELAQAAGDQKAKEVAKTQPAPQTTQEAARQVKTAAESAAPGEKAQSALAEAARVITNSDGRQQEAVSEAVQEVLNPEQQGAPSVTQEPERTYLHRAVLKRLKPLDRLDAFLFLQINHLPHTTLLNRIFYTITFIFTGGAAWYALMGLVTLRDPRRGWPVIRRAALPLAVATALVEYPIKAYFRRRRPFIEIIQAIVIGKKPGTWSFPSGHSATAFAGAWLFSQHFPRWRGVFYTMASLVAFSRIYLGDHYPGDVVSGSTLGTLFAAFFRWLLRSNLSSTR